MNKPVALRVVALAAFVGLAPFAVGGRQTSSWASLVEPLACASTIEGRLRGWGARDRVLRAPPGPEGGQVYRIPTDELGVWIVLRVDGITGRPRLFWTDGETTRVLALDEDCRLVERVSRPPLPTSSEEAFSDRDLRKLLKRSDRLVVYLWSPHLPLSVEGYREAAAAAESLGLAFVALVDPSAERSYVRKKAEAAGIPEAACRPLASVELLFRDLAVHAPTLIVFDRGRVSPPLPGYRNEEAYRKYLLRVLDPAP